MLKSVDLTPFGFTHTESLVYAALLRLGPSTGYAVARAARLARANAYAALEGLVTRHAAGRGPGRPAYYRPVDPDTLLAQLAVEQGAALDQLAHALRDAGREGGPVTREISGARAVANLVAQLAARASQSIDGVLAAELWRPTLPAWRRAATRAQLNLRLAGEAAETEGLVAGHAADDAPTLLVIDGGHMLAATGSGDDTTAVWSSHPLLVRLAAAALQAAS